MIALLKRDLKEILKFYLILTGIYCLIMFSLTDYIDNYNVIRTWRAGYLNILNLRNGINEIAGIIAIITLILAIRMVLLHYLNPSLKKEWSFYIFRPVKRWQVLLSKNLSAILTFSLLALIWAGTFIYVNTHGKISWQYPYHYLYEVLLIYFWGYLFYLSIGTCMLKYETSRISAITPLVMSIFLFYLSYFTKLTFPQSWICAIINLVILVPQMYVAFIEREL